MSENETVSETADPAEAAADAATEETAAAPEALFTETQDPAWPVVALGIGAVGLAALCAVNGVARAARAGTALLAAGGVGLLAWEFLLPMQTTLLAEEVQIRFGRRTRFRIPLKHVVKAYARQYSPLGEFGGWGIRFGSEGRAFNLRGNKGVQLELKSGRKVLIGSQRSAELAQAIRLACGCEGEDEPEIVQETEEPTITVDVEVETGEKDEFEGTDLT